MQLPHPQQNQKSEPRPSHLLTTEEAASHLAYRPYSLRRARIDNLLAGVVPPTYIKRGSRVFYRLGDLDKWLSQFMPQTSTAENRRVQSLRRSQS
jgi:hypothetical protein